VPGVNLVQHLPKDWRDALLVGRLDAGVGPVPVMVVNGRVRELSHSVPTVTELLNAWSGTVPSGQDLGALDELPITAAFAGEPALRLLAPCDLQCVKACGVTFAVSAVERVIEERARGDSAQAQAIRDALGQKVGADIRSFSFASFDDYFAGTEAGAGISGQEYVKLPLETRKAVRETMRLSFPDNGSRRPFVVDMEILVGSGVK